MYKRCINPKRKLILALKGEKADKEVAYWRKEYTLHAIFLGYDTSGDYDLNQKEIPLTKQDLELAMRTFTDEQKQTIKKVIKGTDFRNEEIFYYSWW